MGFRELPTVTVYFQFFVLISSFSRNTPGMGDSRGATEVFEDCTFYPKALGGFPIFSNTPG